MTAAFAFPSISATRTARLNDARESTTVPPDDQPATAWPPLTGTHS